MILAWLTLLDGILAIALAIAGMLSAHFGAVPPFHLPFSPALFGLLLVFLAFFISILGIIIGVIALFLTFLSVRRHAGRAPAVAGVILALFVIVPLLHIRSVTSQYPPINDISTDTQNPPTFVHAGGLAANHARDMSYKPRVAAIQKAAAAYRNLAPLKLPAPPDEVFKRVQIIAGEFPGWQITYNDAATHTLEGIATSALFRFKDDFVIQVRANGDNSLVEMRSRSRDGVGDLGANYNRIEAFFHALQGPPRGVAVHGTAYRGKSFWPAG